MYTATEKSIMTQDVPSDWQYRAEGNCSLVVYNSKYKRVYRILKVANGQKSSVHYRNIESIEKHYESLVQYAACVVDRLFGNFIDVPILKNLPPGFIDELSKEVQESRPGKRQDKSLGLSKFVLDMPDYAFLPSFVVSEELPSFMFELKPGSVCRRYGTSKSKPCSQTSSCFTCLNKLLETEHKHKSISRFCPQELFSGNQKRMKKCMVNLLEDINQPRNRLRFFKDGVDKTSEIENVDDLISLVHPYFSSTKNNGVEELANALLECLTHRKSVRKCTATPVPQMFHLPSHTVSSDSLSLPNGCVLNAFAAAQSFGCASIDEVERAYQEISDEIRHDPSIAKKLCINGPYDTGLWRLSSCPQTPPGISDSIMNAFITVRNYLVYRTAKDSSILVTLQPVATSFTFSPDNDKAFTLTDVLGQKYICCAAIIDLDPKPFSKMTEYIATEKKVAKFFRTIKEMSTITL